MLKILIKQCRFIISIISDNYSKRSGSLWQYCKDTPAANNSGEIVDFALDNLTDSFNFKRTS